MKGLLTAKAIGAMAFGIAVASVGGFLITDREGRPMVEVMLSRFAPDRLSARKEATIGEPREPDSATTSAAQDATLPPPQIELLRAEPDGSLVIAGTAPAHSTVEIIDNGQVIATGKALAVGDYAIALDQPLAPGEHALIIRAKPQGQEPILSEQAGIVSIPQAGNGEVLAMIGTPGEASRIVQMPKSMEPAAAVETKKNAVEDTGSVTAKNQPEVADTQIAVLPRDATVDETPAVDESKPTALRKTETPDDQIPAMENTKPTQPPAATPEDPPSPPVLVRAVDVEDGRVFVAGSGEPGRRVGIYLNDIFRGSTRVGPQGGYILDFIESLEPGNHDLRVDMYGPGGSDVVSRVSVTIDHQPEEPVATAAAEPPVSAGQVSTAQAGSSQESQASVEQVNAEQDSARQGGKTSTVTPVAEGIRPTISSGPATEAPPLATEAKNAEARVEHQPTANKQIASTPVADTPIAAKKTETAKSAPAPVQGSPVEEMPVQESNADRPQAATAEVQSAGMASKTDATNVEQATSTPKDEAIESQASATVSIGAELLSAREPDSASGAETSEPADVAAVTGGVITSDFPIGNKLTIAELPDVTKPEVSENRIEMAAAPMTMQQPVIKTGASVIIRRGDNLWRISGRMFGAGQKYTLIFSANANKIADPDMIYPGQVFDIPDDPEKQEG